MVLYSTYQQVATTPDTIGFKPHGSSLQPTGQTSEPDTIGFSRMVLQFNLPTRVTQPRHHRLKADGVALPGPLAGIAFLAARQIPATPNWLGR